MSIEAARAELLSLREAVAKMADEALEKGEGFSAAHKAASGHMTELGRLVECLASATQST